MDTSALPPDVWHYRLRSARQKKRAQKEDSDKQLLRLDAQLQVLSDAKRALPMVPLQEPYQKGWKRMFVLRADVKESKHAAFYEALLARINTVKYWHDKAFTKTVRRKRKKVKEPIPQELNWFSEWEWKHPKKPITDQERKLFQPEKHWHKDARSFSIYYVFTEPWRYVLKVEPNIITHVKMVDTVLEQEIDELDRLLYGNTGYKIEKLKHGRLQSNWRRTAPDRPWERNPYKNKALHTLLEECKD